MVYAGWNTAGGTLEIFYTEMGWDVATGAPTRARLTALGMADVADGMKACIPWEHLGLEHHNA